MSNRPSKYIIVQRDGQEYPIAFDGTIQHSHMVPKGFTPVSAGFFMSFGGRVLIPSIGSDSLGLAPRPQDREILEIMVGNDQAENFLRAVPKS